MLTPDLAISVLLYSITIILILYSAVLFVKLVRSTKKFNSNIEQIRELESKRSATPRPELEELSSAPRNPDSGLLPQNYSLADSAVSVPKELYTDLLENLSQTTGLVAQIESSKSNLPSRVGSIGSDEIIVSAKRNIGATNTPAAQLNIRKVAS